MKEILVKIGQGLEKTYVVITSRRVQVFAVVSAILLLIATLGVQLENQSELVEALANTFDSGSGVIMALLVFVKDLIILSAQVAIAYKTVSSVLNRPPRIDDHQ
jgi:hypothetical protein